MTVVRKFYPEVRLKKLLAEAGGMTADRALKQADAGLESIREDCMRGLDIKIEEASIEAMLGEEADYAFIYQRSNEIFGEAGALGLKELSEAALSLCSLLGSGPRPAGVSRAVDVHVAAMRALRRPELAGRLAERQAVLQGLRGVSARFTPAPAPAAEK